MLGQTLARTLVTTSDRRNVLLAFGLVVLMAAIRFGVCGMGAAAGASWDVFSLQEALAALLSLGSIAASLFYFFVGNEPRLGMIIAMPEIFLLLGLGNLQIQFLTF